MSVLPQPRSGAQAVAEPAGRDGPTGVAGWTARRPLTAFLVLGVSSPVLAVRQ